MPQPLGSTSQGEQGGTSLPIEPAAAAALFSAPETDQHPRNTKRNELPDGSPGRMELPNQPSVFVTLHDISRGGCCVVRKGLLNLQPGEKVRIEMWREDIQTKASLPATVRWVKHLDGRTRAGLRFVDTSTRTHRLIDQYLQRSFTPGS